MPRTMFSFFTSCVVFLGVAAVGAALGPSIAAAQDAAAPIADPASLAFEAGHWEEAIAEYRKILEAYPEDRLSPLRIAQAERELGRYDAALETLEQARLASAPEAMVDFERARNLLALGRTDEALFALETADHGGLRALELIDSAADLAPLRGNRRFEEIRADVRARVYPCESLAPAHAFDFWLGRWEVRAPDGTLVGRDEITRRDAGCSVYESWQGAGGATGSSKSFYVPSMEQWRQLWTGSNGTIIDMAGSPEDGEMRMEGTIEYVESGRIVAIRARWSVAPDGRVRQRIEQFNVAEGGWDLWFDGFFRRLDE